jgi:eukaryotic-like serine/threonine-protein kinase
MSSQDWQRASLAAPDGCDTVAAMSAGFPGTPMPEPSQTDSTAPFLGDGDSHAFGRYQLFAKLGSGGQADVFLAVARGTLGVDKVVVIKRARAAGDATLAGLSNFLDEARFTLRLNHPNLVHTYEVGQEQGAHFLSMEHIEGLSLKALFDTPRARAFGAAVWLRVVADALSGLSHAHGFRGYDGKPLGIVHRDISPHNIVVSYDGVTKVLDFGIAAGAAAGAAPEVGALTGKVAYMAPEQAQGRADRRSDLFAMGVVLWEMLSGRRLFDGDEATILRSLAAEPIRRLSSVVAEIDPELDELVARALERDPAARYQSANEMRQAIERYLRKSGHVVRELEVSEAMTSAFGEARAHLQARIQQAMARAASTAFPAGELPRLPSGGVAASSSGAHRIPDEVAAQASGATPGVVAAA